jgi:Ca2+-binding RTX toxin-like protein
MAATIFFSSNTTINGTNGDDSIIGNDPAGNVNDLVYGHRGNDTIFFASNHVSRSTLFGGQGADDISVFNGGQNRIYGNLGNDFLSSTFDTGDSIFGGQGDDTVLALQASASAIYGNQGNDVLVGDQDRFTNFFGGQGNDTISDHASNLDAIYGNQGNDLLFGNNGISNSHEYGGQGDDTLVFTGTGRNSGRTTNDVETGGLGNNLFVASNDSGSFAPGDTGNALMVNDIVTVTDFLQGNDHLALTGSNAAIPLVKIAGTGDNAQQALNAANNAFDEAGGPNFSPPEYVFVYGGVGAGYLFHNGDGGGKFAVSGMALTGANGVNSVNSSDIIQFKPGLDAS